MDISNCFTIGYNVGSSWADDDDDDVEIPTLPFKLQSTVVEKVVEKETKIKNCNTFSVFDPIEEQEPQKVIEKVVEKSVFKTETIVEKGWSVVNKKNNNNKKKKNIGKNCEDKSKNCKVCKKKFLFTIEEQDFFLSKGWEERKKCKDCKRTQKYKHQK